MQITASKRYMDGLDRVLAGLDLSPLRGKTVLITGAAGLLGSCLVDLLRRHGEIRVIALGRDPEAAARRFGPDTERYSFWRQDVCEPMRDFREGADYIVHAASNANPLRYAKEPVETLLANVEGTRNLLEYGLCHGMRRFVFVSSGEVYGQPGADMGDFTEEYCGPLDLSDPRSCYPAGKRAAEVLCQGYISQHQADAVIVRPCHLFGPTMTGRDSRAVSEFLRSAAAGRDIVMKSAGLLERSHCYAADAAQALLSVLLKGDCGAAYNIADRRYQMRIRDFAEQAARAGGCGVTYEAPGELEKAGYSKAGRAVLDASRLEALGWKPETGEAIRETVAVLREIGADGQER